MDKYLKFIRTLEPKLRTTIISIIRQIAANDLSNLDIKPLSGTKNTFRCRVGKIRIIFQKQNYQNTILDIAFRGDIY